VSSAYPLMPIAYIRTPFPEKFGIPRQPGLVDASGVVEMQPDFDKPELFDGLETFSHIWISFIFHQCIGQGWRRRVRPPRLGGNQSMGVFATRSPFRPNHLGLSVVRLERIAVAQGRVRLHVRGVDLLDGTPVVDIKPYLPYVDRVEDAAGGFAFERPESRLEVVFALSAENQLRQLPGGKTLKSLIEQLVALDPRPAYQKTTATDRSYGMHLENCNIRWRVEAGRATVIAVEVMGQ